MGKPRCKSGICDSGRDITSFADNRPYCERPKHGLGVGTVQTTPLGFVVDGQLVEACSEAQPLLDPCKPIRTKVNDCLC